MKTVYLDPDYRNQPPRNADGSFKQHCCRCQKEIGGMAYKVTVTDSMPPMVKIDENGTEYLGRDCARKIGLKP